MRHALLVTWLIAVAGSGLAQTSTYKTETQTSNEVFSTTILKIYQAQGDDGTFTAYVVDWRGQEVVVLPSTVQTAEPALKVGDSVRCMMSRFSTRTDGSERGSRLRFSFFTAVNPNDSERLEAIKEEVHRRRRLRESATPAKANPPGTEIPAPQRMSVEELKRRHSANPAAPAGTAAPEPTARPKT
jgi:hypothetical protein